MSDDDEEELAKTVAVADWQAELGGLPLDPPATGGASAAPPQEEELQATIALADGAQAEEIRRKLDELESKMPGGKPAPADTTKTTQKPTMRKMAPPDAGEVSDVDISGIEIPGPRSTGVLLAIASLSTLCLMGVGALLFNRVHPLRPQATPTVTATAAATAATAAATAAGDDKIDEE